MHQKSILLSGLKQTSIRLQTFLKEWLTKMNLQNAEVNIIIISEFNFHLNDINLLCSLNHLAIPSIHTRFHSQSKKVGEEISNSSKNVERIELGAPSPEAILEGNDIPKQITCTFPWFHKKDLRREYDTHFCFLFFFFDKQSEVKEDRWEH